MRILLSGTNPVIQEILAKYPQLKEYLGFLNTPRTRMSFATISDMRLP